MDSVLNYGCTVLISVTISSSAMHRRVLRRLALSVGAISVSRCDFGTSSDQFTYYEDKVTYASLLY